VGAGGGGVSEAEGAAQPGRTGGERQRRARREGGASEGGRGGGRGPGGGPETQRAGDTGGMTRAPRAREMVSAAVRTAGATRSDFIVADQPETDSAPAAKPPGSCTGLATQTRPGRDSS